LKSVMSSVAGDFRVRSAPTAAVLDVSVGMPELDGATCIAHGSPR
jgi:hypothetical protein